MKIFKYNLCDVKSQFSRAIPSGFIPLSVGLDPRGDVCLWAEVEPTSPAREAHFAICPTGGDSPSAYTAFLGTVLDGSFVWHIFLLD